MERFHHQVDDVAETADPMFFGIDRYTEVCESISNSFQHGIVSGCVVECKVPQLAGDSHLHSQFPKECGLILF